MRRHLMFVTFAWQTLIGSCLRVNADHHTRVICERGRKNKIVRKKKTGEQACQVHEDHIVTKGLFYFFLQRSLQSLFIVQIVLLLKLTRPLSLSFFFSFFFALVRSWHLVRFSGGSGGCG